MDFSPNEDQAAFLSVVEQLMSSEAAGWRMPPDWARFDWSQTFDRTLEEGGFFECAAEPTLGLPAAAEMVYRLSGLPIAVECAASAMLRPRFCPELPRPIAVIEGDLAQPVRFLPVARSVLLIANGEIRTAILDEGAVSPVDSIFAYPMGVLRPNAVRWTILPADADAVRNLWRIAVAAEMAGALKAGFDAVVKHVKDREQFKRPLGTFQTVQQRLAQAAIKIEAAHWLTLRAAQELTPADAATALAYVQDAATRITYDLHQFMGAMGLTLEHPLHRWTYRLRLLRSALGGATGSARAAAQQRWAAQ